MGSAVNSLNRLRSAVEDDKKAPRDGGEGADKDKGVDEEGSSGTVDDRGVDERCMVYG